MKTAVYLKIPTLCHEDWDSMTPNEQGKFCSICNKTVVDFENMNDREIINYFSKADGNTCGRFSEKQLNRPLQKGSIDKRKSWKWLVTAIASLLFTVNKAQAQMGKVAQSKVEGKKTNTERSVFKKNIKKRPNALEYLEPEIISCSDMLVYPIEDMKVDAIILTKEIHGFVYNEKGLPLEDVMVRMNYKNEYIVVNTNAKGEYLFNNKLQKDKQIELTFSMVGYEDKKVEYKVDEIAMKVILKAKAGILKDVVVVSYSGMKKGEIMVSCGYTQTRILKSNQDTAFRFVQKLFNLQPVKIFPNPATKGKVVNLMVVDAGTYIVQLIDDASRILHEEQITISSKSDVKLFNIPGYISNGMYYLRLINQAKNKQFVEKMIVQ